MTVASPEVSPSPAPSLAQLRAQVAEILEKRPDSRVIGIRYRGAWNGPATLEIASGRAEIVQCDSVLGIREVLATRALDAAPLVVLTELAEADLGADVLARLARRRLVQVDPWQIVMDRFKARSIDPSLMREVWIAAALIEREPPGGYPPVASGVLDGDTVWRIFLVDGLGLSTPTPDAVELLRWTAAPTGEPGWRWYRTSGAEFQAGARAWIVRSAGAAGLAILDCVERGRTSDAVPLGMMCRVLFEPTAQGEVVLREAAVRFERYVETPAGRSRVEPSVGLSWAAAAEEVIRDLVAQQGMPAARPWLQRADGLLDEVGAKGYAHLSGWLLSGFEQRLERAGAALEIALDRGQDAPPNAVARALESVARHARSTHEPERYTRLEMAVRLLNWLAASAQNPASQASFEAAANAYAREGGFVDWARGTLRGAEGLPGLSRAYSRLAAAVGAKREEENRQFAGLLAGVTASGSLGREVLAIEDVLSAVVAVVARSVPVLLVVMDGMSMAVLRELAEDLLEQGWMPLAPADSSSPPTVIAALPTITEVCRASLLSGRLTTGGSSAEKDAFAKHAGLLAVSKASHPPIVFHKAELTEGAEVAGPMRDAIASIDKRVIGVVINAVDDHLLKANQVRPPWTLDYLHVLEAVLHAARMAGRVAILTSDHGHVLDQDTRLDRPEARELGPGDRWREDDRPAGPDEVLLIGPRVVGFAKSRVIAPWSERTRYSARKNGYHGGVTPQEVVVPLAVLAQLDQRVDGWSEASSGYPAWWDVVPPLPRELTKAPHPPSRRPEPGRNLVLQFPPPPETPGAERTWIAALLASPVYASQKRLAGRVALADDRVRQVLEVLDERGGKLTRAALAHRVGQPQLRIGGVVAALRRLLNVEGYPVLTVDEPSDTVELNRALLEVQFGL